MLCITAGPCPLIAPGTADFRRQREVQRRTHGAVSAQSCSGRSAMPTGTMAAPVRAANRRSSPVPGSASRNTGLPVPSGDRPTMCARSSSLRSARSTDRSAAARAARFLRSYRQGDEAVTPCYPADHPPHEGTRHRERAVACAARLGRDEPVDFGVPAAPLPNRVAH